MKLVPTVSSLTLRGSLVYTMQPGTAGRRWYATSSRSSQKMHWTYKTALGMSSPIFCSLCSQSMLPHTHPLSFMCLLLDTPLLSLSHPQTNLHPTLTLSHSASTLLSPHLRTCPPPQYPSLSSPSFPSDPQTTDGPTQGCMVWLSHYLSSAD